MKKERNRSVYRSPTTALDASIYCSFLFLFCAFIYIELLPDDEK